MDNINHQNEKREQQLVITGKSENDVHNKQKLVKNKKT